MHDYLGIDLKRHVEVERNGSRGRLGSVHSSRDEEDLCALPAAERQLESRATVGAAAVERLGGYGVANVEGWTPRQPAVVELVRHWGTVRVSQADPHAQRQRLRIDER